MKDLRVLRFLIMYVRIIIEAYEILKLSLLFIGYYLGIAISIILLGYLINNMIFYVILRL